MKHCLEHTWSHQSQGTDRRSLNSSAGFRWQKLHSGSCLNTIYSLVCVFWKTLSIRLAVKWKSTEEAGQVQLHRAGVCQDLPGPAQSPLRRDVPWGADVGTTYELFLVILHRDRKGQTSLSIFYPLSPSSRNKSISLRARVIHPHQYFWSNCSS